jgi:DNA-binding NarL/FixJ family response regulator
MNSLGHDRTANGKKPIENKALPHRAEADSGPDEAVADGWPIRTLVVDDSPVVLKTLSLLLAEESGFQLVGTAIDGPHAMRRVIELHPDLVLTDLQMPGMNGLEVTRRIKALSPAPAVIMVTADDTPECRAAASAAGTDGFVGKLNMFTQLRAAIRNLFPRTTLRHDPALPASLI